MTEALRSTTPDRRPTSIPQAFLEAAAAHPDLPALRERSDDGTWRTTTYDQYRENVARATSGLTRAGLRRGERVLLMMRNRPDFHWFDMAAQFLGAVPVSIYNSSSPEEIAYLAENADARIAIVETGDIASRVSRARDLLARDHTGTPLLETVYLVGADSADTRAAEHLLSANPADLDVLARSVVGDDIATLIYTSGTTGNPKGVILTQRAVTACVDQLTQAAELDATVLGRRVISYLPMAHIAERMLSHYQGVTLGYDVHCCPDLAQLADTLRDVRPNIMFGVPRVWEKLRSGVEAAVSLDPEKAQKLKEAVDLARDIKERARTGRAAEQDDATWDFLDAVAFATVRSLVGLDELELAVTGAAPLGPDTTTWFEAIGVPLSEIYGMSESAGPMTWSPRANRPGSVGRVIPDGELRLDQDGEILYRGPNLFSGYWQNPEKTAETLDDGWLRSGDIGTLSDDGYLTIVDRKKELIITSGGKNISPANLEAALKTIPLIGQAAAIGDGRNYCTAILVLDPETTRAWAAANGKSGKTLAELADDPDLTALVDDGVQAVNQRFAQVEQIKRHRIIGDEWLPDSDVLTPTAKLKRRGINQRYAGVIADLYS